MGFSNFFQNAEINLTRNSNNFDFLRLFAASLVLIAHSSPVSGNVLPYDPFGEILGTNMGHLGVVIFFIISGFLIAYSWSKKQNVLNFFIARVLRIYPAVIAIVLLSVFVLGPLITSKTINEYFSSNTTSQYIQNVTVFRMYYYLPGVFEYHPLDAINSSLWTLPYEFTCYIFLMLFGILTIFKNKLFLLSFFVFLISINSFYSSEIDEIVIPFLGIDFKTFYPLFLYFICGTVFFYFKNYIKLNILGLISAVFILYYFQSFSILFYIKFILLTYIILTIAFYKPLSLNKIGKYGDFSYGIYLYAFPVQQLIFYFSSTKLSIITMVILSILFTLPFAVFSWFIIEKPAMGLRSKLNLKNLFTLNNKLKGH